MSTLAGFHKDAGSKFFRLQLSEADEKQALGVSPYFLAYLQNKIEAYASALVDTPLTYDPNPANQVTTIINYERARTMVQAYEELLAELLDAQQTNMAEANLR